MNRYGIIKFIFITCIFLALTSICADLFFTKNCTSGLSNSPSNKIQRLFYESHNEETPIFGSSRAEKGYYCDSLGADFYNYGMPNASFGVIQLLLKPELKKNKTSPIVIDIHHDFFKHDAYENINIATYLPFINKNDTIKDFLATNGRLNNYQQIPGLRYYGFYTDYLRPMVSSRSKTENTMYIKGGVFDTKKSSTATLEKRISAREAKKLHFEVDSAAQEKLLRIIETNPERKFVFVVSPYHKSAKKTVDNFEEMLNYFNKLDAQFENVIFIYFNTDNYSDDLWKDTVHLNIFGAKKFSGELSRELHLKRVILN